MKAEAPIFYSEFDDAGGGRFPAEVFDLDIRIDPLVG
jgi:hypothetical protein